MMPRPSTPITALVPPTATAHGVIRRSVFWQVPLIVAVTMALYWPAREAGFVGDDFMILHRLRDVTGLPDALRFFRGEFFEYYRPLAFVSHALDWTMAGADPRQFHLTNLLLHAVNAVLVFLIARALAPGSMAGLAAALLFALHASNHEAVVWMSARFDLLATAFSLAAVWWMVTGAAGSRWGPAALFLAALLSKESTVALPMAAAAWTVFWLRSTTRDAVLRVAPWLVALTVYALLRQAAGGVPATGGAARAPKLIVFAATLAILLACADQRWLRLRAWLRPHGRRAGALLAAGGLAITFASVLPLGVVSTIAREKLSVAGFALIYLFAPVTDVGAGAGYLQPLDTIYWRAAVAGLPALALVIWAFWRRLLDDDRAWFMVAWLMATLLPISALTEGRRYLYLPSAVVSVAIGAAMANLRGRRRALAVGAVAGLLAISSWRIGAKVQDWIWAGEMTAAGARLADEALAPACNEGHVVFLTSPVGVRGVYTHFYYETFGLPRGCIPETFQVVARVLRLDTHVSARWITPDRIEIIVVGYRGNLVISEDFRHFDVPLRDIRKRTVTTPLGELLTEPIGDNQRLTLTLSPGIASEAVFMVYSDGRIRRLSR